MSPWKLAFGLSALALTCSARGSAEEPIDIDRGASYLLEHLVRVDAGSVVLGEGALYPEEAPMRRVDVAAFWIDRFEVTNAQFARFVSKTGWVTSAERADELGFPEPGSAVFRPPPDGRGWTFVPGAQWRHPEGPESSIVGREHEPVVQVSQRDAMAYAAWLGRRLPTESEWEHAARSGADIGSASVATPRANTWQGVFPTGNTGLDGYKGRAPVGSYPPSALGIHDLFGNVWEWTSTPYLPNREVSPARSDFARGHDPRQPHIAVAVIKGGSFLCSPNHCNRSRPAARQPHEVDLATDHIGFRTVLSATADAQRAGSRTAQPNFQGDPP